MVIRQLEYTARLVCASLAFVAVPACEEGGVDSIDEPELADTDGTDDPADTDDEAPAEANLTPSQILTRASLDVRGVRPTPEELETLAQDPSRLDPMIAGLVDDPAFAERIKGIFAGAFRTRTDEYYVPEADYDEHGASLTVAIGEEPLNLIAYVALNDLPFTEVVTAESTFVDPALLDIWPLEEVAVDGNHRVPDGLIEARYTDGRPSAGVLSTNAVFWRHGSTFDNANRGRANAISQALLCQSYLDRPIDFPSDVDLTDSESINTAIKSNAACQGCHSTLDPLASYMWGFMYDSDFPLPSYSSEGERRWQDVTQVAPGFYGQSGQRLTDLGNHIAGDERFVACAVRRVYQGMLGRAATLEDEGALAVHREAFLDADLSLKSLVRSILEDPAYRGRAWSPRFGGVPEPVVTKVAPVDVLENSLATLSGYRLTFENLPATRMDSALRRIAGGTDRGDTTDVSTGAVLVQRRLAEAGATHAVDAALDGDPGGGRLDVILGSADLRQPPQRDAVTQLLTLARSQDPVDAEVDALQALWTDVSSGLDAREAWIAVVTAVLADPDHLLY